ncbi:carboxypeptidase-like regulatory domain-containing protein [Flavisericum labens]|uniref:carboxypeptidase-like regulatory domain-containing protein n=1 Tax=Flavisericum labens TaxID=3377112 RepID=UPI00387AB670
MKKIITNIALGLIYFSGFSQSITARLVSNENDKPIPYASIKTGEHTGVISNEEGYFTIKNQIKTITISCMGYKNKILSTKDIKASNFIIKLSEATNQLSEVYISNKIPNADSIIAQVRQNISKNYDYELNKHSIFRRSSNYANFESLEFEIEKASHVSKKNIKKANADLRTLSQKVRESDMVHFTDFKGELYAFNQDSSKLNVQKATKLIDYKNDFSIEEIQENAQNIVLTYLDTTKTYKVKTGIFKVEDSLSLNGEDFKDDDKNEFELSNLNDETRALLGKAQFLDESFLSNITDKKHYEYTFKDATISNNELNYIIHFEPRRGKSKYTGTLYVSDSTYAITRVDYNYYKKRHGGKVNLKLLLGIKYIANVSEGTLLFERHTNNMYQPKYIKHTSGSYFYVSRDLKFIENSTAKNKIGFSFKIEGSNANKEEILFTENSKLSLGDFETINQEKKGTYQILNKFDQTLWESDETLEPLEEMKAFEGGE